MTGSGSEHQINPSSLARTLESECAKKASYKSSNIPDFSALVENKGFSSATLQNIVSSLLEQDFQEPTWDIASRFFEDKLEKELEELTLCSATFGRISLELRNSHSIAADYLRRCGNYFDPDKFKNSPKPHLKEVIESIDQEIPDCSAALKKLEKECVILYHAIKLILSGGES